MLTGRVTKTKVKEAGPWIYTIEVGTKGNRKRKVGKKFRTRNLAKEAMEKAMEELEKAFERELGIQDAEQTLGEFLIYWLEAYARHGTAPNTFKGYKSIVQNHVNPSLGHIKLPDLRVRDILDYFQVKLKSLSAQTVKHHHRLLTKALNDAIEWEFVTRNVALKAKPPLTKQYRPMFYSKEELNRLFKAAEPSVVYLPFIFIDGHTGMRLGELRALQWSDVDLKNRRLSITKTAYEDEKGKVQIKDLTKGGKTRKDRTIVIGKKLLAFLKEHHARYLEMKQRLGLSFNPNDLVCCNANGDYIKPRELHRAFKAAIKRADLKDARIHDLRHSHASILLSKNVHPKIVSERLGHSKIGITMDLYSHVIPSLQEQAVHVFDDDDED
jgi:integrase